MIVYDFFILCEKEMPGKRTLLRGTSFALRRAMVDTIETLCEKNTGSRKGLPICGI